MHLDKDDRESLERFIWRDLVAEFLEQEATRQGLQEYIPVRLRCAQSLKPIEHLVMLASLKSQTEGQVSTGSLDMTKPFEFSSQDPVIWYSSEFAAAYRKLENALNKDIQTARKAGLKPRELAKTERELRRQFHNDYEMIAKKICQRATLPAVSKDAQDVWFEWMDAFTGPATALHHESGGELLTQEVDFVLSESDSTNSQSGLGIADILNPDEDAKKRREGRRLAREWKAAKRIPVESFATKYHLALKLANALLPRRNKRAERSELAGAIYGDPNHDTSGTQIPSLRTKGNQFFDMMHIPWAIGTEGEDVFLDCD
ncbi:MAG TPA: hypothetical protein DDX19_11655 [Rhodopirellula baltica]|nr:hypothetical protein [Rhodopirellula baltica]